MSEGQRAEDLAPTAMFSYPEAGEADPRPIVARLLETCEDFADLHHAGAQVLVVMRHFAHVKAQRIVLGTMSLPAFGGANGRFGLWLLATSLDGELPDFLMTLDAAWWADATPLQREALVHHELCHAAIATDKEGEPRFDEDGRPVWTIKGHDLEEFRATVRRYGAWDGEIAAFIEAARQGGA